MHLKALSATGIRDFLQCQLKVVFRYDREIPMVKNDHAKIGIAVHEALEQFTRRMQAKQSFPDPSDYDFAITTFMNVATKEGLQDMGFYTDGRRIVTDCVDKFDPSEEIIDVECRFKVDTPDGVPIVGAIDKVVKVNDDTIAIIDYKTSRNALTPYQLRDDVQLSMYDLAASILWPEYANRLLILDYVRIDKKVSSYRTAEERQAFREFLQSIWTQISKLNEQEVKGRINRLCGWCDYQSYCPEYAKLIQGKDFDLVPLTDMDDASFLEHWEEVSTRKSLLDARQRELKMIASERFMNGEDIKAEGKELYSVQYARTNYNVEDVVDLIPQEDLYSVLNVNKTRLDRYAKDDPELKNQLARLANVSYNAPVFKTRAVEEEYDENAEDSAESNEKAS